CISRSRGTQHPYFLTLEIDMNKFCRFFHEVQKPDSMFFLCELFPYNIKNCRCMCCITRHCSDGSSCSVELQNDIFQCEGRVLLFFTQPLGCPVGNSIRLRRQ